MKKCILYLTIIITTIVTSGCAPFWRGRAPVNRVHLAEQPIINDSLIKTTANQSPVSQPQWITAAN